MQSTRTDNHQDVVGIWDANPNDWQFNHETGTEKDCSTYRSGAASHKDSFGLMYL